MMEKILEKIKCACPHECSGDCFYCNTNYDFVLDKPIPLKCGHCICQNCELKLETKIDLKCVFCKSKSIESIIQKDHVIPKTFEEMFISFIEMSIELNNTKLQEKYTSIESKNL